MKRKTCRLPGTMFNDSFLYSVYTQNFISYNSLTGITESCTSCPRVLLRETELYDKRMHILQDKRARRKHYQPYSCNACLQFSVQFKMFLSSLSHLSWSLFPTAILIYFQFINRVCRIHLYWDWRKRAMKSLKHSYMQRQQRPIPLRWIAQLYLSWILLSLPKSFFAREPCVSTKW